MKRKKLMALLLTLTMLLTMALPWQAIAAQGDVREAKLALVDNGWTQANAMDDVQDSSSNLLISGIAPPQGFASASLTRRNAYLKFDLAEIDYDKITSAKLFWYTTSFSNNGLRTTSVYALEDGAADWSGDTLTWGNAPDFGLANEDYSSVEPVGQLDQNSGEGAGWGSIDLSDYFATLKPDMADVTLVLTVNTGATYISPMTAADGTAPYVEVTYDEGDGVSPIPRSDITVRTLDNNGETVVPDVTIKGKVTGRRFKYGLGDIETIMNVDGVYYQFDEAGSVLETEVKDGAEIIIRYNKIEADEDGFITLSIPASDMGWSMESSPADVQNNNPEITVSSTGGGGNGAKTNRNGFVKFDLSAFSADIISDAKVHLYLNSATNAVSRDINIFRTGNEWDSKTLNWNNQPAAVSDILDTYSCWNGATGWIDYDVFANLSALTKEDKEVSFRIEVTAAAITLASHLDTNGHAPTLELTFMASSEGGQEPQPVYLRRVDENGGDIAPRESLGSVDVGRTYFYEEEIPEIIEENGKYYLYDPDSSTLSIRVSAKNENEIILVYTGLADGSISSLTVSTVTSDGKTLVEPYEVEHLWVNQEYFMNTPPEWVKDVDGVKYGYSDSFSSRRIYVKADPDENKVTLMYKPLPTGEPSGELKTAQAPVIDAGWAMEATPNTNQVTNGQFDVSRSSKREWSTSTADTALQNRIGLMKFDLSSIAYDRIASAKIHFTLNSASNDGTRVIYAYPVSSAWDTGTVTWNTAPLIAGERPDSAAGSITLSRLTGATQQEIDVTEFMKELVGGETDISFLFEVDTASVQFSASGAYLDIEYYEGAPTEARRGKIVLRTVDIDGNDILEPQELGDEIEGRVYTYGGSPAATIKTDDGRIYSYNSDESVTSLTVKGDGDNEILLVYDRLPIYPGEPAEVSLVATDNAFVVENAPTAVQDSSRMVQITGTEGGNGARTNRDGLVKFDASFVDASQVDKATLSFVVTSATNAGGRTLTVYAAENSDWSSATATWNDSPGCDVSKPLDSVDIGQNGTGLYEFDVTEYLKEIQADIPDEISFRIKANTAVTELASVAAGIDSAMKLNISYVVAGEVGERVYKNVTVRYEEPDGQLIKEEIRDDAILGRAYTVTPAEQFSYGGKVYIFRPALTTGKTTVTVREDESLNVITLVYEGYDEAQFYTDNILAGENAWINDGVANMPTTDENGLVASSNGGVDPAGTNCDILLKFDMNYINFSKIVDAKVRFYVRHTDQAAVRTTSAYPVSSSWVKGEVSWNNAPSYRATDLMGTVSFPGGNTEGWFDIDITDYLASHARNGMGSFSVRLAVNTGCYYVYPVEEGEGTAPRLVVSYLDDGTVPRQDVTLRVVDQDGKPLENDAIYDTNIPVGRTYKYNGQPEMLRTYNGATYVYMENKSTTSVVVDQDPSKNVLVLVYGKEDSGEELKVVFSPYMNAYSDSSQPDAVQDTSSYLLVTNMGGSVGALADRNTYLMFSLAEISFSEITSAKLGFYVNRTGNNTGRTVSASLTEPTWTAETLTWNNAPAIGEAVGGVTFNHNETGWYELDLTEALKNIENTTVDLSIGLSSDTASSYITSIEAGDGLEPKLEITYINDGTGPSRERVPVYMVVEDGEGKVLKEKTQIADSVIIGATYVYAQTPEPYFQAEDGTNYMFNAEKSNLSVKVADPKLGTGDNTIHIVYDALPYEGNIVPATAQASDNGYTNDAQPGQAQSSSSGLLTSGMAGSQGANSTRNAYVKFDLKPYKYSKIISAKLRVYLQQATNNTSRKTDFYLIGDNGWDGASLTWDNAPQFGSMADTYLGSMTFSNGAVGWYELDITDCLEYMDYTDTMSIAFRTDTAANYWGSIASKQAAELELVYIEGEPVYYERANISVQTVDELGNALREPDVIPRIAVGSTYSYPLTPEPFITIGDDIYTYKEELSSLTVDVVSDKEDQGLNVIKLVYSLVSGDDMFSGYEITPEGSYCWFADNRAYHYANEAGTIDMTYVGYIDVHGSIKATQYNNLTGEVSETLIRTNFQPDDHDNPAFLVLPDENILIIYSRHTDESAFYYRVSTVPGDITALGPEKRLATNANTTYPNPFILSDDPEHIYMFWRGTNWHPTMAQLQMPTAENDYTLAFTWGPRQLIHSSAQSSGCRPYAKYASNGKDTVYVTYSATHPDNIDPVSIYFNAVQITDFTEGNVKVAVKGATGETLTTTLPFRVNNTETDPSFVVDDRSTSKRGWVWEIALDENEIPVIAMVRISSDKKSHTYYYAKWDPDAGEWVKTKLDDAGGAFHLSSAEQCYSGGMSIDSDNPSVIYGSVPVKGVFGSVYEIIRYTMSDDGRQILKREQITSNSEKNNVRPYSIPGTTGEDEFDLVWMNGDYWYWIVNSSYPEGFPTAIHTNYEFEGRAFDAEEGLDVNYTFTGASGDKLIDRVSKKGATLNGATAEGGVLNASAGGYVQLPNSLIDSQSFTISAFVEFSAASNWGGTVLSLADGQLKYAVDNSSSVPTLTVSGEDHAGSNIWSNSDWNRSHGGTTDGSTNKSNPGETHLAITYDAQTGVARTYINGMADQYIQLEPGGLSVSGYNILGQYNGTMSDFRVYDRALSSSEIKAVMEDRGAGLEKKDSYGMTSAAYTASSKTVKLELVNNEAAPFGGRVFAASYTPSGELQEVKKADVSVGANGAEQASVTFEKAVAARGSIKAFLWDGLSLRPIQSVIKVK